MKKYIIIILSVILMGCQSKLPNQKDFIWGIYIKEVQLIDKLQTDKTITHYDGSSEVISISDEPTTNNIFLLVKLEINKNNPGVGIFSWSKLLVIDENGKSYARIADSFISQHNYERLPSIDIRLGENTGWIAFEISKESKTQKLSLVYSDSIEENRIPLTK
jgi:hypothetical protein